MAVNRADIDALLTLSEEAEQRADATETRAAIGIIMANRRVDEREAFDVLRGQQHVEPEAPADCRGRRARAVEDVPVS